MASALAAAPAGASSIVYLKDGNVQVAAPDGGNVTQITTTGPFEYTTQSDDGTIFATKKGEENGYPVRRIYKFDRNGNPIGTPVRAGYTNAQTFAGPIRPQASPDGSLLAYHYFYNDPDPTIAYAPTDRDSEYYEYGFLGGYINPAWYDNSHVTVFIIGYLPNVVIDSPGPGDSSQGPSQGWFTDPDATLAAGEINRQLTAFAAIRDDGAELRLYKMNGAPPAAPTATCSFQIKDVANPTWSPDGHQVAFEAPDGIHVASIGSIDDCGSISQELVIPGGTDPDWGPADAADTKPPALSVGGTRKLKASALLAGPSFPASCSERCGVIALIGVKKATAKKLGLGKRDTVIANGKATLPSGAGKVRLKLTSSARKKLRHVHRSFGASLVVVAVDASGNRSPAKTVQLTIKR